MTVEAANQLLRDVVHGNGVHVHGHAEDHQQRIDVRNAHGVHVGKHVASGNLALHIRVIDRRVEKVGGGDAVLRIRQTRQCNDPGELGLHYGTVQSRRLVLLDARAHALQVFQQFGLGHLATSSLELRN